MSAKVKPPVTRSTEYCKAVIADEQRCNWDDMDAEQIVEMTTEHFFDQLLRGERAYTSDLVMEDGSKVNLKIHVEFDPNADFDYCSARRVVSDGTLYAPLGMMETMRYNVLMGITYAKKLRPPRDGDEIKYTIGNFVLFYEYDKDGSKFAPKDKPWSRERVTCMLPIKMEYLNDTKGGD